MLAGLVVAARTGFEMPNALEVAEKCYVDVNIHDHKHEDKLNALEQLPASCYESALELDAKRELYEKSGVFSKGLIDGVIAKLKSYNDNNIRAEIKENPSKMMDLVNTYYHCG
jgi:glutamine synthetase